MKKFFAVVQLEGNDTTISGALGFDKMSDLKLRPGKYRLTVRVPRFKTFLTEIEVIEKEILDLQIKLGRSTSIEIFNVYSRKKLTSDEVKAIKKCVEASIDTRQDYGKKGEYYLMMEI